MSDEFPPIPHIHSIKSDLVVISWWSNCLGLTCLRHLTEHTHGREIYVIQVGKSPAQNKRFRGALPAGVKELLYAEALPAEHCKVVAAAARQLLPDAAGLWFIDHDAFVHDDCEPWLQAMDATFSRSALCMCYPYNRGFTITNPAFWLSPARFPAGLPDFAYIPYKERPAFKRPDLYRNPVELIMPEKDTLVLAKEFLEERGMARRFPVYAEDAIDLGLRAFPRHTHLSGLHILAGEILPTQFFDWMSACVKRLTVFFEACPEAWVKIEDPVLLQRLREFQAAVARGEAHEAPIL